MPEIWSSQDEQEEEEEEAVTLTKSRDPHLAGGAKHSNHSTSTGPENAATAVEVVLSKSSFSMFVSPRCKS